MNEEEFNRRLRAIADAFGTAWLTTSTDALPKLWRRKDAFAVNQLCILGDAISGFNSIDKNWVKMHVKKIKGPDANERRGSMFELLGANLFRLLPQTVRPTRSGNPGYDLVLTTPDNATADISLKCYGLSTHEMTFRQQAVQTEDSVKALANGKIAGRTLFAIASTYPSSADWDELRAIISTLPVGIPTRQGNWEVKLGLLPPDYAPFSTQQFSYQVFIASPFHQNEHKNLSDKFDTAFANAEKHADQTTDRVRIVLMRIPEAISLRACDEWAKAYLEQNLQTPIDGIYLYQMAVIDRADGTSVLGHSFCISETPRFVKWRVGSKPRRNLLINLAVGIGADPSKLQLTNGQIRANFQDGYHYQRGNYYTLYRVDPTKTTNISIRNLASGIFQHAVLKSGDGSEVLLSGHFPPTKEVTLFD